MAPILKLELTFFGAFDVHIGGQPVSSFRSTKAQALLCYLAVSGRLHSRSALSGLLWGDTPEEQARASLRQTLSNLTELCTDCLTITRQSIAFDRNYSYALDSERFEGAAARLVDAPGLVELHVELALYRGDFLEGFYVRNAPDFETWMLGVRARYRELALQAFDAVAVYWMERGDTVQAIFYSHRLLEIEPWHEDAHRRLMQLLAQSGQRAAALEQYRLCRQLLVDELGIEPDEATTQLYMRIRGGDFTKEAESRPIVPASSEGSKGEPVAVPHNLRQSAASFVGRAQELEMISQRLADPTCRLLTLAGAGGIGKSRLALHAAHALLENERAAAGFRHGVYYVALAAVVSADLLPSAIADAFGVHLSDADVRGQLLIFLSDKAMLLILDNFEHLMDGIGYLTAMLEAAPQLKLVVTSRQMLQAQEEWLLPVERMPFPEEGSDVGMETGPESYDAVMLFVQRARQAQAGFSFVDERKNVLRICSLTGGFPLAIELASALLRILPCAQLVRELEDEAHGGLDVLSGSIRNVPDRHHSMRTVFNHSWGLLSDREQALFARLALFHGGFERPAAEQIAGASFHDLAGLVSKSLLILMRATPRDATARAGRYEMHELLRQFAQEKLAQMPAEEERTRAAHCAYYLGLVAEHSQGLVGNNQRAALEELARERDNLRAAWHTAVQLRHAALAAAVEGIYLFHEIHGPYSEGLEWFARAVARYEGDAQSADLLGRLTIRLGGFHFHLGEYELAERCVQAGITHTQDLSEHAFAYVILGDTAFLHSNRALAEEYMRKSLSLSRQAGHLDGEASVLRRLMFIVLHRGDSAEALLSIEEALRLYRQIGPPDRLATALSSYALLLGCLGRYDEAETLCQESLAICTEIGFGKGIFFNLDAHGWIRWCRGEGLREARAELQQALAMARQMNSRYFISMILSELSQLLADIGEAEAAVRLGAEGVTIARELASPERLTYSLFCLAAPHLAAGDLEAAAVDLREGLSLSWSVPFISHVTATLYFCGELWARLGERLTGADRPTRLRRAHALLVFVRDHPACWRVYQDRAGRWLAQIETALLPETVSSAPISPMHDLAEVVQIVLNDFA